MPKKTPPINYTNRDFSSIRQSLIEYAKRYYPDTFRDFSDSSFGSLTLESVAYIGDILSFYLDYSATESFIDSAVEYNNILRHARNRGYRLDTNPTSFGKVSIFIQVPANAGASDPDFRYAPILRKNTEFISSDGNSYLLLADVDFSDLDKIDVVVATVDETSGVPSTFAIRAKGTVISGELNSSVVDIGPFKKFRKVTVGPSNIAEITSVFDAEGHEYFEVQNLSQDVVYKYISNENADKYSVPSILKPVSVPRRYVVERDSENTYLIFGHGTDTEFIEPSVLDPTNTVLKMYAKDYITDTTFDPTELISSDSFGIAPTNTKLTINYRQNLSDNVNASAGSINEIGFSLMKFTNPSSLSNTIINEVKNSLQVINDEPVIGSTLLPNTDEIRIRTKNYFATQNRCVSATDYKAMCYAMPPELGSIKRVNIFMDKNSFKRNMNMYVVSEDRDGNFTRANETLKNNLKTWLNVNKMVNDTIDILDAKIVNFGIKFNIVAETRYDKYDVLQKCINKLAYEFRVKQDIGESIMISKIYNSLNEVEGVEDVVDVEIVPRIGSNYSTTGFNFKLNITADGRMIRGYENLVFELKNPQEDIFGSVI